MISSPVKCFIIQLTLAFVVFFDNTLATSYEDWCENEINNIDIPLRDNARVLCKYFLESFLTANEKKQKSFWEDQETIQKYLETPLKKAIEDLTDALGSYNTAIYTKVYKKAYKAAIEEYKTDPKGFNTYSFEKVYEKAYEAAIEEYKTDPKGFNTSYEAAKSFSNAGDYTEDDAARDFAFEAADAAYNVVNLNANLEANLEANLDAENSYNKITIAIHTFNSVCVVKYFEFLKKKEKSPSNT